MILGQPGQTIGVVGGGQLGRMFVLEARRAGYKVVIFTDEPPESPASEVADFEINAPYTDLAAAADFARRVSVVTYEFENVPGEFLAQLEARGVSISSMPHGPADAARTASAKNCSCVPMAFPVPRSSWSIPLRPCGAAITDIPMPCVLKTADFGYDGKGQIKILDAAPVGEFLGAA